MDVRSWNALALLAAGSLLGAALGGSLAAGPPALSEVAAFLRTWQPLTASVIAACIAAVTIRITLAQNASVRAVSAHKLTAEATEQFVAELVVIDDIERKLLQINTFAKTSPDFDWSSEKQDAWFQGISLAADELDDAAKELGPYINRNPLGSPTNPSRTIFSLSLKEVSEGVSKWRSDNWSYLDSKISTDESKRRDEIARIVIHNAIQSTVNHKLEIKRIVRDGRAKLRSLEDIIIR